jgi:transketolase
MKYNFSTANLEKMEKMGARNNFGIALADAGDDDPSIIVVTADLRDSSKAAAFAKAHPDRFYNTGIAEQNLVSFSAGFAKAGFNVFATSFSCFISFRACEQIRLDVCYNNSNVKMVGVGGGFAFGVQGNTHYSFEELALLRAFPNLTLFSPSDGSCIYKAVEKASGIKGPVFIRITSEGPNPVIYKEDWNFETGKVCWLTEGSDVTIFATGSMTWKALKAASRLAAEGIGAAVADVHTVKPFDKEAVRKAVKSSLVVTVEEHGVIGGLGGLVAEEICDIGNAPPLLRIGNPDVFGKAGTYLEQIERYGLTVDGIRDRIRERLGRKL